MRLFILLFSGTLSRVYLPPGWQNECYNSNNLNQYQGTLSTTFSGETCQNWNARAPHRPKHGSSMDHNYCRNPDNDPNGPWCYTTDPNVRFAYCDVPTCARMESDRPLDEACLNDNNIYTYSGLHNKALKEDGEEVLCQSWSAVKPHRSMFLINEGHHFCRNPNHDPKGPWCYTTDKNVEKAYCNICDDRRLAGASKSGTCGNPKITPQFQIAKIPSNLRSRRSAQNEDYYDYYDYADQDQPQDRVKVFPKDRTQDSLADRIVGGETAQPHSFPWMVSLRDSAAPKGRRSFCGGSVIAPEYVLTAAHCVMDLNRRTSDMPENCFLAKRYEIYAGSHTKDGDNALLDAHKQQRKIEMACLHPRWDKNEIYADAALIKLSAALQFNDYVQPICLPTLGKNVPDKTQCAIAGWGSTKGTTSRASLNQQTLPLISNRKCNQYLGNVIPDNTQMCAGYKRGGVDTCQGDSGGPLMCQHDGVWIIDGIVSWGYDCALPRTPGVYTRVSSPMILNWIKEWIA